MAARKKGAKPQAGAARRAPRARDAFLVRLPPQVLDAIKALAEQEMRSANAQIEVLLREALARRGRKLDPPGT